MSKLTIVDGIMGSGKSTYFFEKVDFKNVLFATEYRSEIERAIDYGYNTPDNDECSMLDDFKLIVQYGGKIAITHKLFKMIINDKQCLQYLRELNYRLIVDESISLISPWNGASYGDLSYWYKDGKIAIDANDYGRMEWLDKSIESVGLATSMDRFINARGLHGSINGNSVFIVQVESKEWIDSFQSIHILTYNHKNTLLHTWLLMMKVDYDVWQFADDVAYKERLKTLLTLSTELKFNRLPMSTTWYETKADQKVLTKLSNYISNTARKLKADKYQVAYTFPSSVKGTKSKGIQPPSFPHTICLENGDVDKASSGHISCNRRASNEYAAKSVMFHLYNRYADVGMVRWMEMHNLPFDNDVFALNEMLQWLWRGCIRNNLPMNIFILNNRMYRLFNQWMSSN